MTSTETPVPGGARGAAAGPPGRRSADGGAPRGAGGTRARARGSAHAALVALVLAGLGVAATAAAAPSALTPSSRGGFPGWFAGPLGALDLNLGTRGAGVLVVVMAAAYGLVLVRAAALGARAALLAIGAAHVIFLLAPPLFTTDPFGYLDYARLAVVHGLDPYVVGAEAAPLDPIHRFVIWHADPSPYGPLFTLLTYGVVPLGVAGGVWALKVLAFVAALAAVALVGALARGLGRPPVPAVLFVGLNPVWLVFAVGGGHNDLIAVAGVLGALALLAAGRERLGGVVAAAALAVKASAGLALPFVLLAARRRAGAAVAAAGALAGIAALVLAGLGSGVANFPAALAKQQALVSNFSVPRLIARALGLDGLPAALRVAFALAGAVAIAAALAGLARGRMRPARALGWATLALLVTSAWLVPWYAAWLVPLTAVAGDRRLVVATLGLCALVLTPRVVPLL